MPIFPQLGDSFYDTRDRGITSAMEAFYANSITWNQSYWAEASIDSRFVAGDQTLYNEIYGNLTLAQRKQFNFNRIRRIINMISGHQRRNRKSTIVVPVENADEVTADQFTKIMYWLNNKEGVLETISNAFEGGIVTGMNLLQVWVDYRSDPVSGNIKVDNCAYNSFLIDPYFRKTDLSDCNGIWKRSFVNFKEANSLLPGQEDLIAGLQSYSNSNNRDGKFQFMPESYNWGVKDLLTYDEYYYRDYRKQKLLVDTDNGETQEWSGSDSDLREFRQAFPQVDIIEAEIPTVKLAIVLQGKVMYEGPNPIGIDQYPFVPVLGYYHPEIPYYPWRIQGVVRGLRDAQFLYNRRKVIELDILESQINSGWKYKENALVNPKDVFLAGQGRGLALKEEAQMSDVEQIQAPQVPPSMIQLSQLLGEEIQQISGVNEELLGSAQDDKAGVLSMLRQSAGLTTLQTLFDQLDYSQKLLGKLILRIIQSNFTPGKVRRILNDEPSPEFYNKHFGVYDSAVEEGINTTTQRQTQFAQLMHLKEIGLPIPDDVIIDSATIQNKKELKDSIAQQQQATQQQQEMQAQVTMEEIQARTNLANARAEADKGLGAERMSRIPENRALALERVAKSEQDRQQAQENKADAEASRARALLDLVKSLKEIEMVDIQQLEKLMGLATMVQNQSQPTDTISEQVAATPQGAEASLSDRLTL
jgi:hypothetical protein